MIYPSIKTDIGRWKSQQTKYHDDDLFRCSAAREDKYKGTSLFKRTRKFRSIGSRSKFRPYFLRLICHPEMLSLVKDFYFEFFLVFGKTNLTLDVLLKYFLQKRCSLQRGILHLKIKFSDYFGMPWVLLNTCFKSSANHLIQLRRNKYFLALVFILCRIYSNANGSNSSTKHTQNPNRKTTFAKCRQKFF